MFTLANIITLGRLALLPAIILLIYQSALWAALILYILAAITDFLDGYLARKMNQITPFGTFLDPIADKIFVAVLLVVLVDVGALSGLWIIAVLIILIREFLVSGLREFLGPHKVKMPVTKLAKWKTTVQMLSLGFLILGNTIPGSLMAGQGLLVLAAILTVITGWGYLKIGLDVLKKMS